VFLVLFRDSVTWIQNRLISGRGIVSRWRRSFNCIGYIAFSETWRWWRIVIRQYSKGTVIVSHACYMSHPPHSLSFNKMKSINCGHPSFLRRKIQTCQNSESEQLRKVPSNDVTCWAEFPCDSYLFLAAVQYVKTGANRTSCVRLVATLLMEMSFTVTTAVSAMWLDALHSRPSILQGRVQFSMAKMRWAHLQMTSAFHLLQSH
jgi:hypothetical protein